MNTEDRSLGMNRDITRRDFVNGAALAASTWWLPGMARGTDTAADPYPPQRLGMRGSHPGSFEAAHALRDAHTFDASSAADTGETYDLVVVGGGLSGLAAAHFYLKNVGGDARVLILENHDDFGGHAKRNEMHYAGKTMVINGGTLEMESPQRYNLWARELLSDIGVDIERFRTANRSNESLYTSLGLQGSYFFDKQTFGTDRLVVAPSPTSEAVGRREFSEAYVRNMPISERAKRDLLRLNDPLQPDYLPGMTSTEKKLRLARTSYQDYLLNIAKVDPQAYWFYMATGRGVFSVGADAVPALFAWSMGYPGFSGLKLDPNPDGLLADLPGGQHGRQKESNEEVHFPDGNATLARLLVRRLIPDAVPGTSQEDSGAARVNYGLLDRAGNQTRIRLNSMVLNVRHDGDAAAAREVLLTYNNAGSLRQVRGRACVMACWNMFIPYLVPELPAAQKEALAYNVKTPLVYTSVFLRNWQAFAKLGISNINCPTMYHDSVALTQAADLGDIKHPRNPSEPIALHLTRMPGAPGLPRKEQHRIGRAELLATSFSTFERNIRDQLARTLGRGGFDPAADIVGIAVNRWPHGYSYTYNSLYDPLEWVFTESDQRPCVAARKPYGLITIANADAAASPHTDAAFLEAHRAIEEVLNFKAFPFVPRRT